MMLKDNLSLWEEQEAERERELATLPVCDYCGEPITDGFYYAIDGETVCKECLDEHYLYLME